MGFLGDSAVKCLPSAQGMILETQDQIPCQAHCMEPASPSAYVSASLSLSLSLSQPFFFFRQRASKSMSCGEKQRERKKQTALRAGSPMQGSVPGPWDHDLSQRQTHKQLSHPRTPTPIS